LDHLRRTCITKTRQSKQTREYNIKKQKSLEKIEIQHNKIKLPFGVCGGGALDNLRRT
jgi:hypothetical protein